MNCSICNEEIGVGCGSECCDHEDKIWHIYCAQEIAAKDKLIDQLMKDKNVYLNFAWELAEMENAGS